jgi:hypothetical protein
LKQSLDLRAKVKTIGLGLNQGTLPIEQFIADEYLRSIERGCRCTKWGWHVLVCGRTTASGRLRFTVAAGLLSPGSS